MNEPPSQGLSSSAPPGAGRLPDTAGHRAGLSSVNTAPRGRAEPRRGPQLSRFEAASGSCVRTQGLLCRERGLRAGGRGRPVHWLLGKACPWARGRASLPPAGRPLRLGPAALEAQRGAGQDARQHTQVSFHRPEGGAAEAAEGPGFLRPRGPPRPGPGGACPHGGPGSAHSGQPGPAWQRPRGAVYLWSRAAKASGSCVRPRSGSPRPQPALRRRSERWLSPRLARPSAGSPGVPPAGAWSWHPCPSGLLSRDQHPWQRVVGCRSFCICGAHALWNPLPWHLEGANL